MTDLTLTRIVPAKRQTIWRCWTEAEHLKHWFVPKPHVLAHVEIDPRPGGRFDTTILVDGTEHPGRGVILEAVPAERLAFTDCLTEGWVPAETPFFAAIITFSDHPDGTEYTALARHRSAEDARRHEEMGFIDGWGTAIAQLAAYAAEIEREETT